MENDPPPPYPRHFLTEVRQKMGEVSRHLRPICQANRAFPSTALHYSPRSEAEWEGRCVAVQISDGGGHGLTSTANSTRAILPPILDTINSKGRLPPAGKAVFDSNLRTPTTRPPSSYAVAATQTCVASVT